ncbi:unnamed protein product [Adineta ricciae]|uniref:Uncharacterized protein n=1 Tax=Adineta ricciae TaxID=249248 RepID=A0A815MI32_ADIRI|nr:unnamed protein product [Adineta ricciae]CAF1422923.1 unnamed protein product [Adineta ricciae]
MNILLILLIIIYFLYFFHDQFSGSSPCSHLYEKNFFQKCSLSTKILLQSSSPDVNYVVFDAVNGFGNRILGLISSLTYALVTNRVLLINWKPGNNHDANFEDLFLPLSSLNESSFVHQYSLSRLMSLVKNRWINEIHWQINRKSRIPRDWAFYFDEIMLCDDKIVDIRSWFQRFGFYLINLLTNHVQ